ncbi:hypothetical protein KSS87_015614 [Heliosperma pusillum]|nr:hypothetical protein KSS87_015614 [Heliosperma pusillum]
MADKQLIVVVEGTGGMGPYWNTIVSDYLHKIIRSFCANDSTVQKSSASAASDSTFELALVVFNTHGPYSAYVVRRSGWTRDVDNFFYWLSALSFSGGGWDDVATTEGLAEALMMFAISQNGFQAQQDVDGKRHCVLVSASNPYPLPTPVYRPNFENLEVAENGEEEKTLLYDAETVSKWFGQCSVSLSVICPKQLPKLRAIYNAAKRSEEAPDPTVDVKQPHFLVLISDGFSEACSALLRSGVSPSKNPNLTQIPGSRLPVFRHLVIIRCTAGRAAAGRAGLQRAGLWEREPEPTVRARGVRARPGRAGDLVALDRPDWEKMGAGQCGLGGLGVWAGENGARDRPGLGERVGRAGVAGQRAGEVGARLGGPANGSTLNKLPISTVNAPPATIKAEPSTVTSIESDPAHTDMPSMARPTGPSASIHAPSPPKSEDIIMNDDSLPELKPVIGLPQPVRTIGDLQNGVSSSRVPIGVYGSNMMSSGMTSNGPSSPITGTSQSIQNTVSNSFSTVPSNVPTISNLGISHPSTNLQGSVKKTMGPTVSGTGQGYVQSMAHSGASKNPNIESSRGTNGGASVTGSKMPTPGLPQQAQGMQSVGMNGSASTVTMSQQGPNSLSSPHPRYIKFWEGDLCVEKHDQRVLITKAEGFRSGTTPETLAANWPPFLVLGRLIPQDYMHNKQFAGKAVFLVFRAMHPHGFLLQLQEKKLCAMIQLPSQTLLLSVSDKAYRLIGVLLPWDIVASKFEIPIQVSLQNLQQPLQRQHLQQQQQQQQQTIMQMVSGGMSQGYMQPSVRPQSVPQAQGQVPSQGTSSKIPGGGFMP